MKHENLNPDTSDAWHGRVGCVLCEVTDQGVGRVLATNVALDDAERMAGGLVNALPHGVAIFELSRIVHATEPAPQEVQST